MYDHSSDHPKKTPAHIERLKAESERILEGLAAVMQSTEFASKAEVDAVVQLLARAEKHLDTADPHGYYPTEEHTAHLDIASGYAALGKAAARAIAARIEEVPEPPRS